MNLEIRCLNLNQSIADELIDRRKGRMENIRFTDVFSEDTIDISGIVVKDKEAVFEHMAEMLFQAGRIKDKGEFIKALYEREDTGSTYMGEEMAVPHGKSQTVVCASAAFCRLEPFQYVSGGEEETVRYVIMLAVPENTNDDSYMKILSSLSRLLVNNRFRDTLKNSCSKEEILRVGEKELALLPVF